MKSRLVSSVLQPIMWLIFIGVGFSSALRGQLIREVFGGLSYITFMAPGIVVMSSFFTAFFSAISVI
ncbi:MAG: ABC transporter, partial [Thermoprotei archaeon]